MFASSNIRRDIELFHVMMGLKSALSLDSSFCKHSHNVAYMVLSRGKNVDMVNKERRGIFFVVY